MVTVDQLLRLARDYLWQTQRGITAVSVQATGNDKTLVRLRQGHGANIKTIDRAALWFSENWPEDMPWPDSIPRPLPPKEEGWELPPFKEEARE